MTFILFACLFSNMEKINYKDSHEIYYIMPAAWTEFWYVSPSRGEDKPLMLRGSGHVLAYPSLCHGDNEHPTVKTAQN